MIKGRFAVRKSSTAAEISSDAARGRGTVRTVGSKNATGKSHESACTSWGKARNAGPEVAGSIIVETALGSE